MKRIMIATALTTTLATSAFAVTEGQIDQIEAFAPGMNTSVLSETELQTAYGIVTSGDSVSEKRAKLRSLTADGEADGFAMISEAEMLRLQRYAPNIDLSLITQSQAEAALAITYGGESEGDKAERVQAILSDAQVIDTMSGDITVGQSNMIQSFAPDVDVTELTEEDVELILSFIHGGMSRSEALSKIESIVNS